MEEDSKIPNRPGVIWLKDLVQHCSTEYKQLLTPTRGGSCRHMKAEELSEGEMSGCSVAFVILYQKRQFLFLTPKLRCVGLEFSHLPQCEEYMHTLLCNEV